MSYKYAKFEENPCVGTDESTPFRPISLLYTLAFQGGFCAYAIRTENSCDSPYHFQLLNFFFTLFINIQPLAINKGPFQYMHNTTKQDGQYPAKTKWILHRRNLQDKNQQ